MTTKIGSFKAKKKGGLGWQCQGNRLVRWEWCLEG